MPEIEEVIIEVSGKKIHESLTIGRSLDIYNSRQQHSLLLLSIIGESDGKGCVGRSHKSVLFPLHKLTKAKDWLVRVGRGRFAVLWQSGQGLAM